MFWTWGFIDPKKFKLKLNDERFIEDFQIYFYSIIKCDFDDFQSSESESNFQNTDEFDTRHPCCSSSD
jgi:hypothetical protein